MARLETRLEGRVVASTSSRPRRVFTWRNRFRRAPAIAEQPGCPLRVLNPRLYSQLRLGSGLETMLRFELRNVSSKTIHSYVWRHVSSVKYANGGAGCHPENGLAPDACQAEAMHLTWRGPQTVTVDFVQFADGTVWLSADPLSLVTRQDLDTGTRTAIDHLLRVRRESGITAVTAALPMIHRDVQLHPASVPPDRLGPAISGFYAGVTRAAVLAGLAGDRDLDTIFSCVKNE